MYSLPDNVHFTSNPDQKLSELTRTLAPDQTVVIVDENTRAHCLPLLPTLASAHVLCTRSGETHKTLDTCQELWHQMTELGLSRRSLVVNLGGGVIGDMGGFVASTYKRGMPFINIPTTLLAQVDASMGGKLGVDFQGLKNHIGVFRDPDAVILFEGFLSTLPERQLRSGYAEVIKHGLIWDVEFWNAIERASFPDQVNWNEILRRSVEIKGEVVREDPLENGLRKILNFGHTLGHAIESWHMEQGIELLHGEAIAIGMIMESHLSVQLDLLQVRDLQKISALILSIYPAVATVPDAEVLSALMQQDKKNVAGTIRFSLIEKPGKCRYDVVVEEAQIKTAVDHYKRLIK